MFGYMFAGFAIGWTVGALAMWWHFARNRLLRTRKEWYADPVIKARYGEDEDPEGWSY